MAIDLEKEKKKNIKLAIGVAAIGIFFSAGLYVIMFALLFLRPGLVFSFMPFPTLSKNIAGINNRLAGKQFPQINSVEAIHIFLRRYS